MSTSKIDSRIATNEHIGVVRGLLARVIANLRQRGDVHDQSKLVSPEVEILDEYTPKLATSTYGSEEYKSFLVGMKPGLDHHYAANSHHPEHYADGIQGMSLLDLTEMLCDWKAATLRHNDGDIRKSVQINQKRFGYSDELKRILLNTLPEIEATDPVVVERTEQECLDDLRDLGVEVRCREKSCEAIIPLDASKKCARCRAYFCDTHLEQTTWYGGDVANICVDCVVQDVEPVQF